MLRSSSGDPGAVGHAGLRLEATGDGARGDAQAVRPLRQGGAIGGIGTHCIDDRREQRMFGYRDRKNTRLNSSHVAKSYGVFFLIKKRHMRLELRSMSRLDTCCPSM